MIEEPLPDWAERTTDKFEVGAQLCTRDGRKMGNALIVNYKKPYFTVDTEFNKGLVFTEKELQDLFYMPKYIKGEP